ncbi:MAG TPA: acetolactate synthase small subunit [Firmicutes bacterium]|nr:acetolactate synthase small subunit [Bacillota bacterium]
MESQHILSVLADNNSGVLLRISGLFSRRGYNIASLSAAETENPKVSRMTIVVNSDEDTLEQICKQLNKLVDIKEVRVLAPDNAVCREHILIQAGTSPETRSGLIEVANLFRANILDTAANSLILELTGSPRKIQAFVQLVEPYGIRRLVKTGVSALERGEIGPFEE